MDARKIINNLSTYIDGGGGGQPFLSTAGGKNSKGISNVISIGQKIILEKISN